MRLTTEDLRNKGFNLPYLTGGLVQPKLGRGGAGDGGDGGGGEEIIAGKIKLLHACFQRVETTPRTG